MKEIEKNKLYRAGQVLKILNISRGTLYRWNKAKLLKRIVFGQGTYRYQGADLLKLLTTKKE